MNVATRISQIAEANAVVFSIRGNDRNDIDALAEAMGVTVDYSGNDEVAADNLEAAIAALP